MLSSTGEESSKFLEQKGKDGSNARGSERRDGERKDNLLSDSDGPTYRISNKFPVFGTHTHTPLLAQQSNQATNLLFLLACFFVLCGEEKKKKEKRKFENKKAKEQTEAEIEFTKEEGLQDIYRILLAFTFSHNVRVGGTSGETRRITLF